VALLEAEAIRDLASRFGASFDRAVELIVALTGRLVVTGAGKSGQIAAKVAATLTSTGTPATFVHPADAVHGDLGLLRAGDAALLFSKSGSTDEVCRLLPLIRRMGAPVIAVTGHASSELGRNADLVIETGTPQEASPFGLVPTSSATAALVVGDALAVALLVARGFARDDFVLLHPGGVIGRALTTQVGDIMHRGDDCPRVGAQTSVREALDEIISKRLGMTTVVDGDGRLLGVLTDGDLKRILIRLPDPLGVAVEAVMSTHPRTIASTALVAEALEAMEENRPGPITSLVVVDGDGRPEGVIHLHDCLAARP
jgi:arabinose-5-phosphate isomerase